MQRWPELREETELAAQASSKERAMAHKPVDGGPLWKSNAGRGQNRHKGGECQKAERKQRVPFCEAQEVNGSRRGCGGSA